MSVYTRPVLLLLSGLLLLTVSMAVLNTMVPLWLVHQSLPTWQVGIVASAYFTGNLVGTLITGRAIQRWGFNRTYYYACILFALSTLGLALSIDMLSWGVFRFLAGIACASIWVIVESALLRSGTLSTRGQLLAAYMMVYYAGTLLGQLLLSTVPTLFSSVLPWVTMLLLIAILPLLFTSIARPEATNQPIHVWSLLKRRDARLGIIGCIISGIVLGALYGLLPIYLTHSGLRDAQVGYWMALLVSAGIVGQWPFGKLADRYGRLNVLRLQVFVIIISAVAVLNAYPLAPALFMLGLSGFTLYPVAMAWACEKATHNELVAMNQGLLLSYTLGSLAGPALTAVLMQHYSDRLLFVVIACSALIFMLMLFQKTDRQHKPLITH